MNKFVNETGLDRFYNNVKTMVDNKIANRDRTQPLMDYQTPIDSSGYKVLFQIKILYQYADRPILFTYTKRNSSEHQGIIRFKSLNSVDPDLDTAYYYAYMSGGVAPFHIAKINTSTWQVYVRKDSYQEIQLNSITYDNINYRFFEITYPATFVDTLPENCIMAREMPVGLPTSNIEDNNGEREANPLWFKIAEWTTERSNINNDFGLTFLIDNVYERFNKGAGLLRITIHTDNVDYVGQFDSAHMELILNNGDLNPDYFKVTYKIDEGLITFKLWYYSCTNWEGKVFTVLEASNYSGFKISTLKTFKTYCDNVVQSSDYMVDGDVTADDKIDCTNAVLGHDISGASTYMSKIDMRDKALPEDIADDKLTNAFTSFGAIETGTNDNKFVDAIFLNNWHATTGGRLNALVMPKKDSQAVYHYTGDYNSTSWNKKRLVYADETIATANVANLLKYSYLYSATQNKYFKMLELTLTHAYEQVNYTLLFMTPEQRDNNYAILNLKLALEKDKSISTSAHITTNSNTVFNPNNIFVTYKTENGRTTYRLWIKSICQYEGISMSCLSCSKGALNGVGLYGTFYPNAAAEDSYGSVDGFINPNISNLYTNILGNAATATSVPTITTTQIDNLFT